MKPSGFNIIELLKTIILPEAHAMNKSITQDNQNDKQISTSSSVSMEKDGISRSSLKSVKAI